MRIWREGSTQSKVFDIIKANREMTVKGLQTAMNLPGQDGYNRISTACQSLKRAGSVRKSGKGTYRFVKEPGDIDYCRTQQRMIRVIRIRTKRQEPFTARVLSELTDSSLDLAKRYIVLLKKEGFIEAVGKTRVGKSNVPTPVYLANEDKLNDEWPAKRRRRKTSEMDEIVINIRDIAYRIARECEANRESIMAIDEHLKTMTDLTRKALKR